MSTPLPPRSWLYVPATRLELLAKALDGPADAVIIDLEDAVPAPAKDRAREDLAKALSTDAFRRRHKPVWVRINHPRSPWGTADIAALAALPADGVRLPKCEDVEVVAAAAAQLQKPVHLLIESATGVRNADTLARASEQVTGIALGEADLLADLGGSDATALAYARGHIVLTSRAAGLGRPVMSVFTNIADLSALATDSRQARASGFFGRTVVHPRQVPIVNAAFTPAADEVETARRLVDSLDAALLEGRGAQVDERGNFIDAAVVAQAQLVLALAEQYGGDTTTTIDTSDQENQ